MAKISLLSPGLKLFRSLWSSDNDQLVIEISSRFVRLAYCQTLRGKEKILKLADAPVTPPGDEAALVQALNHLLDSQNIHSQRVILSIPRYSAMLRFMSLPSSDAQEIEPMAKMEILRQVPYSEDEVTGAYKVIRNEADGYSLVLLVAVLKNVVERAASIFKSSGLVIDKVVLGAEALTEWFFWKFEHLKDKNIFLVSAGEEVLDMAVLEAGKWVFSRGVLLEALPKEETAWLKEVAASISAHQKNSTVKLEGICFLGSSESAARLELLAKELALPFYTVDSGQSLSILAAEKIRKDAAYASLSEVCQNPEKIKIDLLPSDLLRKCRLESLKKNAKVVFASALVLAISLSLCVWKNGLNQKELASRVESEIQKNKSRVQEADRMSSLLEAIQNHTGAKPLAVDIFAEVHHILPSGVTLEMFDYEDRDFVALRGSAAGLNSVFECAKELEKSRWFSSVRVRYANKHIVGGQENADFEIQARIGAQK